MDQKLEDELLMHVAAGTDPLTALAALPRDVDEEGDQSGGRLYVFINRRRDRAKLLYWDGDGLAIWYKYLEEGTFHLPMVEDDVTGISLSGTDLAMLLQGIDLKVTRRRKCYRRPVESVTTSGAGGLLIELSVLRATPWCADVIAYLCITPYRLF